MSGELTDAEVERIDILYNATDEYLAKILNFTGGYVEGKYNWDLIDRVIEAVWDGIKDKGWISEMDFYPVQRIVKPKRRGHPRASVSSGVGWQPSR